MFEGLVAVLEVHPTGLTMHVVLPFVGVLQHGSAAGVVELVDAHLLDLVDRVDAEFLLRLKLGGQAVGVPAEHAVDLAALHGLVARDHVPRRSRSGVAVVRKTVRKRRAIEEHEFVLAVVAGRVAFNGLLEGVVLVPVVENGLPPCRGSWGSARARSRRPSFALGYTFSLTVNLLLVLCTGPGASLMAIAGRRRVPAGFTNVTYRTVGPIASIASQPELTVFRPEQPCLPFLPTRTMTGAGMRSAPRYHLAYRTGLRRSELLHSRAASLRDRFVFGCLGPIPSVLLGDCRRSSEDSPLITDHRLTTVHIVTRHAVKSPPTATANQEPDLDWDRPPRTEKGLSDNDV